MRVTRALAIAAFVVAIVGCTQEASTTTIEPRSQPQGPSAQAAPINPLHANNDRVCKSMYGLPCNDLVHMLGPMNAELRKESRACVRETISVYVSGEWVPDNKYQNRETGERYGDHCIAVSL